MKKRIFAIQQAMKKALSGSLAVAIFVSSLASPALAAQNLGPKAEANILVENTQHLRNAVKLYNIARNLAEKTGPQAFVDELPAHILSDERKYFLREINRSGPLPELQMTDTHVLVIENKLQVAALDIRQILSGVFVFPKGTYQYNFRQNAIQNMERWKAQGKTEKMNASMRFLEWINPLPQAHAFSTMTGVLVGGLLGALIGVMIKKFFFPEKLADHGSDTTPAAVDTYTPPPAAAAPTTPAADGTTPPPSGGGGQGPTKEPTADEKKKKEDEVAQAKAEEADFEKNKKNWWFKLDSGKINQWVAPTSQNATPEILDGYPDYVTKVLTKLKTEQIPAAQAKIAFRRYVLENQLAKLRSLEKYKVKITAIDALIAEVKKKYGNVPFSVGTQCVKC